MHITGATTTGGAGIIYGRMAGGGASPHDLVIQYVGAMGSSALKSLYDPDNPGREDLRVVAGMYLIGIRYTGGAYAWTNNQPDLIFQVVDGTHTPTGNPNEYTIKVRLWESSSHADIVTTYPAFSPFPQYLLCPVDLTHPLQQDTSTTASAQHTTGAGAIGSKVGMSEIFDKITSGGSTHNSTEIVTATTGSKVDGTITSTIPEPTPT